MVLPIRLLGPKSSLNVYYHLSARLSTTLSFACTLDFSAAVFAASLKLTTCMVTPLSLGMCVPWGRST